MYVMLICLARYPSRIGLDTDTTEVLPYLPYVLRTAVVDTVRQKYNRGCMLTSSMTGK
jgi:hypothetical protein